MQNVEKLAFILVHTLCLYVENRIGVDDHPLLFIGIIGKLLLFQRLDLIQSLEHAVVVFKFFERRQFGGIFRVSFADTVVQKRTEFGVRLVQPAPVRDAVGDVRKLRGRIVIKVAEDALFNDFAVQFGNAVDLMRTVNGQIRHFTVL